MLKQIPQVMVSYEEVGMREILSGWYGVDVDIDGKGSCSESDETGEGDVIL